MYKNHKILAVVTARGGSKGLPGKNIKVCAGKPLIQWTLDAAKKSEYIDEVFVSTDCENIQNVVHSVGGNSPFLRPDHLGLDDSPIEDVLQHVIDFYKEQGDHFDYVILLQPTSPLRTSFHIDDAIKQYFSNLKSNEETLVSVYPAEEKAAWLIRGLESGYMEFCLGDKTKGLRRQELSQFYYPNGAIYFFPSSFENGLYTKSTQFFVMDRESSIDIDTMSDFEKAQNLLLKLQNPKS
tara:strand:- start:149638 stop:150351 length:714 start_codon:yes stop_codon:yes gene_type:complete